MDNHPIRELRRPEPPPPPNRRDEFRRRVEAPERLVEIMWDRLKPDVLNQLRTIHSKEVNDGTQGLNSQQIGWLRLEWEGIAQERQNMPIEQIQEMNSHFPRGREVSVNFGTINLLRYCEIPVLKAFNGMNEDQNQDWKREMGRRAQALSDEYRPRHLAEFLLAREDHVARWERRMQNLPNVTSWPARWE
jgi:hypothetical protein